MENLQTKTQENKISYAEHLQWCKDRANEYVEIGDFAQAFASMGSDLKKHPETENHPAIELGFALMFNGHLDTAPEMKKFIDGFN